MYTDRRRSARIREEKLARKRNQEYHRQLVWDNVTQYYKSWDLQASTFNGWNSPRYYETSAHAKLNLEKEKNKRLEERRACLNKLLSEEQNIYEQEMKEKRSKDKSNRQKPYESMSTEDLKLINLEVQRREEEKHKKEVEVLRYNHWKASQPVLRDFERKQQERFMKQTWKEQIKEKQAMQQKENQLMLQLEEEREKRRIIEEETEKALLTKKQEEAKKLKEYLLQQMNEIKEKERETEKLDQMKNEELKLKADLEMLDMRRSEMEKKRINKELTSFLRHQYHTHLKMKNKQIQEELIEDAKFIDEVAKCLEREQLQNKLREETRKKLDRANGLLKLYAELEKERASKMEFMFHEEAKKMWNKQDSTWRAEQKARSNLMRDVMAILQRQVNEKLKKDMEDQKQLMREREEQLNNMEDVNRKLKEQELEIQEMRKKLKHDLEQQVKEKEEEKEKTKASEMEEYKREQLEIAEEEERILNELKKMNMSSRLHHYPNM